MCGIPADDEEFLEHLLQMENVGLDPCEQLLVRVRTYLGHKQKQKTYRTKARRPVDGKLTRDMIPTCRTQLTGTLLNC